MKRFRCQYKGIVQGVGFRPFIFRTARKLGLTGSVCNSIDGAVIEVQGAESALEAFFDAVLASPPPLSSIISQFRSEIPCIDEKAFVIAESLAAGDLDAYSPPDSAICDDCLRELFDPSDRRYRYPFINCTNCGPRLTIVRDLPYDRPLTSMSCFPLCPACSREYADPGDRRFHAQPNACPACGPQLTLLSHDGSPCSCDDPILETVRLLKTGMIVAVKGLGGFHLAVDAASDEAVGRLRSRKCREQKPFAVMVRDAHDAVKIAHFDALEERLLSSPQRPIVLLPKRGTAALSESVAPGMRCIGVMLAYTPVQHLLLKGGFEGLVMTSANRTDEPICIGNREAVQRLEGIADYFLVNNRDILVRCDDSIIMTAAGRPRVLRRARGFVPRPLPLGASYAPVLALGPHMKSTICIIKDRNAFLSPHIGDLDTPQAREFFYRTIDLMKKITGISPAAVACDMHPGYFSGSAAKHFSGETVRVQHHHAHVVSCMAENGISGKVIGLSMDGTGYGTDGTIWGGEILVADETSFYRAGHLAKFPLPGGEAAIREPWRIGASLLRLTYGSGWLDAAAEFPPFAGLPLGHIDRMLASRINCPETSSLGRLFDGIAAILGIRSAVTFEGQAAMELESSADDTAGASLPFEVVDSPVALELDYRPAVRELVRLRMQGHGVGSLSRAFHSLIIEGISCLADRVREKTGIGRAALSGGCFQNRLLLEGCIESLTKSGFEVFSHHLIPANDGGISLGQAVVAASRLAT